MGFRLNEMMGAECQMGEPLPEPVDLDEVMDLAPPEGGAAGVLKVAEERGLQVTPPQH
jgi:hypothetical protein